VRPKLVAQLLVCSLSCVAAALGCSGGAPPKKDATIVTVTTSSAPPPATATSTAAPPPGPEAGGPFCDDAHGPGDASGAFGDLAVEVVDTAARAPFEPLPAPVVESAGGRDFEAIFKKARGDAAAAIEKSAPKDDKAKLSAELGKTQGQAFVLSTARPDTRIVLVRYLVDKASADEFLYMRHDSLLYAGAGVVRVIFQTRGDPSDAHAERVEVGSATDLDGDGSADAVVDYRFARNLPEGPVYKDHGVYVVSAKYIWPKGPFGSLPAQAWGHGPFAPGPFAPVVKNAKGDRLVVGTGGLTFRCLDENDKKPLKFFRYAPGQLTPVEDGDAAAAVDRACDGVRAAAQLHPITAPTPEASDAFEKRRVWAEHASAALVKAGLPSSRVEPIVLRAAYLRRCR
jgi:hypothetical protein